MAAAMGADEYGFGSVAMIATGCIMARICHTNNCPVGVASQVLILNLYEIYSFCHVVAKYVSTLTSAILLAERGATRSFSWCAWRSGQLLFVCCGGGDYLLLSF